LARYRIPPESPTFLHTRIPTLFFIDSYLLGGLRVVVHLAIVRGPPPCYEVIHPSTNKEPAALVAERKVQQNNPDHGAVLYWRRLSSPQLPARNNAQVSSVSRAQQHRARALLGSSCTQRRCARPAAQFGQYEERRHTGIRRSPIVAIWRGPCRPRHVRHLRKMLGVAFPAPLAARRHRRPDGCRHRAV